MRVRISSPAEADLAAALEWYAEIRQSLSSQFLAEYDDLLARLRDNPQQFPAVRGAIRRAGFRAFPYGLFYRIHPAEVEIIACLHSSRDPSTWRGRL